MALEIEPIYDRLYAWCASRGFAGYDPFDGLNSKLFQATPLRNYRLPRLALTQLVKRSPVNLRPLLGVEKGMNAKGIALFALAELSRYRVTGDGRQAENARTLLAQLIELGHETAGALSYGYNFDWQSRAFFAPLGTPTIVPSAFASQAFAEGASAFDDQSYRSAVDQIAKFAANDLNRPLDERDEICFSYTSLDREAIYNASLLAAECLARSSDAQHHELARKAMNFVIRRQREDGAWTYGDGGSQTWVDNFHTAYVLQSFRRLALTLGWEAEGEAAFEKGKRYWLTKLFLDDGTPKYYDGETYPIDIHSAAVAIAALAELGEAERARDVAAWTVGHMRDTDGFFYYRLGRVFVDQTPFMRWGQAWMTYALARLMEFAGSH